ncbi:MAG: response regulator [Alistipes sp.]
MDETRKRIVLVDDHALFRNGLKGLIDGRNGCCVVGEFSDGADFVKALPSIDADAVFMDISMPVMNGDAATVEALRQKPDLKVICLSMFGDEKYYSRMMEAGAKGFLLKDSDIDEVFDALETVMAGENYLCHALLESISGSMHSGAENPDALSERESDVLLGICRGLSNQEIADSLFISKRTVDAHRANILEKTGCKNTASLVVYAVKNGLVEV